MKRPRVLGTTEEAIDVEESLLRRELPRSFRVWLLENNGLDIAGVHIYPVRDERDIRKTWESLSYNLEKGWAAWLPNFEDEKIDLSYLLPFADYGTGDYYCFDYAAPCNGNERPVVRWSHETGETEFRAKDFTQFKDKVVSGEFGND